MTLKAENLELRELASVQELKDAEQFQRDVWGEDDPADNSDIMLALQHEGGLVAGAFSEGRMLGFLFGFPTRDPQIQHSHRLAVHPDSRGLGLGAKLKWYQRDWCLERGITSVRWTFDPLRRINASLNIARLGATANTYHLDYYGQMEGINAGVPSDRIVANWELNAAPVSKRAAGEPVQMPNGENTRQVIIPENLDGLLANDLDQAIAERMRVRQSLTQAFAEGWQIAGFDTASSAYVMEQSMAR